MPDFAYLCLGEVIAIHDGIVELCGDPHSPLLFPGKLESALQRPLNAAHYEGADLVRIAALLAVAISQAQAFLDGNKRAGFAAAEIVLRLNGLAFSGVPLEAARWLEAVAAAEYRDRDAATNAFAEWLRGHTLAIEDPGDEL